MGEDKTQKVSVRLGGVTALVAWCVAVSLSVSLHNIATILRQVRDDVAFIKCLQGAVEGVECDELRKARGNPSHD